MTVREPTNGHVVLRVNGCSSNRQSAVYLSTPSLEDGQSGEGRSSGAEGDGLPTARYPHIKDLQDKAEQAVRNINPHIPVCTMYPIAADIMGMQPGRSPKIDPQLVGQCPLVHYSS